MEEGMIESVIKTSPIGKWYIELTDATDESVEPKICWDVFAYADAIEEMGKRYNGMIEIHWSKDENVTPEQVNEVRMQMHAYEAQQAAVANGEAEGDDMTPDFLKGGM